VEGRILVVDYAHNEEGMKGLVEIAEGLRRPGATTWLAYASAGDRTDEIIHGLGYLAARGADRIAVAELRQYLRGREPRDVVARLRAGALDGGATEVPVFPGELHALRWMLRGSSKGDVLVVTALGQRNEIFEEVKRRGGHRVGPEECRRLARQARAASAPAASAAGRQAAG
jgi:cyanophycin synthetase